MQQRKPVRVVVDSSRCVGSSMCVSVHPELFGIQGDAHAAYIADAINIEAVLEAEELCPVSAIQLIYED